MAAHTYWRIFQASAGFYYGPCIAQIIFYDSGGSQISTAGATITASSQYSTYGPSNAFDGIGNSQWRANTSTNAWIEVQFPSPVDIDHLQIWAANADFTGPDYICAPGNSGPFDLQYSDNNSSWTTLLSWSGVPWKTRGQKITFTSANSQPASPAISWRIYVTAAPNYAIFIAGLFFYDLSGTRITVPYSWTAQNTGYTGNPTQAGLVDIGDCTSWWWDSSTSGIPPGWIRADFPTNVQVGSFKIIAPSSSGYTHTPTAFSLQYSLNNGSSWVTAGTYNASWVSGCQEQIFLVALDIPVGALTLTGFAPALGSAAAPQVPVGSLVLTGFSPLVVQGTNFCPIVPPPSFVPPLTTKNEPVELQGS